MDWRSVTFDWNRARAFLVTAEEGSLSAAARALGMTQPTLGRQVSALEGELGMALFERVGRGLVLTPGGRELLDHVRGMGDAASRVALSAAGQSRSIEGTIRIAAAEVTAAFLLPPIVRRLRAAQPGIEIEILSSNLPSDLLRREADIALRSFRPTEPDLVARRLRDVPVRLYATPEYLQQVGRPTSPAELARASFIGFDDTDRLIELLRGIGLELTQDNFPVRTLDQLVQWALVRQGVGIGIMLEEVGDAEGTVQRALPGLDPIGVPMWLVAHREVNSSRRVRLVFDLLAAELGTG